MWPVLQLPSSYNGCGMQYYSLSVHSISQSKLRNQGFSIKRLYNLSNIFLPMFSLGNLSPCLSTDDIYSLRLRHLHHLISKLQFSRLSLLQKNSCFQLIHSPSCYPAVQLANHIQSCSLNQPITILVSITIETVHRPWFLNLAILLFLKIVIFIIN